MIAGIFTLTFFIVEDFRWNPLKKYNYEYTEISFKSVLITSFLNFIIFSLKPLLSDIGRTVKLKLFGADSFTGNELYVNDKYEKCNGVHKTPYLNWSQLQELESVKQSSNK